MPPPAASKPARRPSSDGTAPLPAGRGAGSSAPASGAAVLVVDDSRVARAAVEARLARRGVAVVVATGCAEAAEIDVGSIGAALLDLELGDGTGVELAAALRRRRASLPVAFLTSAGASELADGARRLGPVFDKGSGTAAAVAWAARAARGTGGDGSGLGAAGDSG